MNLIVAVDENWGIGNAGDLLVRLPGDLKNFQALTKGHVVVLGRETLKTFRDEKPLKYRTHFILSRDPNFSVGGAEVVHSLSALFTALNQFAPKEIFVIGGQQVYEQLLPYTTTAYVTKIRHTFGSDRFFPNLDTVGGWELIHTDLQKAEMDIDYAFCTYQNLGARHSP